MLNLDALRAIGGDNPAFLDQILDTFVETTRVDIEQLAQAVRQGDNHKVRHLAHRIKGACALVGAEALASMADRVEQVSLGHPVTDCQPLSQEIQAGFQEILASLDRS